MLSFKTSTKSRSKKFGSRALLSKLLLSLGAVVLLAYSVQGANEATLRGPPPTPPSLPHCIAKYGWANRSRNPQAVVIMVGIGNGWTPFVRIKHQDQIAKNCRTKARKKVFKKRAGDCYILCNMAGHPVTNDSNLRCFGIADLVESRVKSLEVQINEHPMFTRWLQSAGKRKQTQAKGSAFKPAIYDDELNNWINLPGFQNTKFKLTNGKDQKSPTGLPDKKGGKGKKKKGGKGKRKKGTGRRLVERLLQAEVDMTASCESDTPN